METYYGPEPQLDEERYAILSTRIDEETGEYSPAAAATEVVLLRQEATLDDVYNAAAVIDAEGRKVTAICTIKVIDLLVKEEKKEGK